MTENPDLPTGTDHLGDVIEDLRGQIEPVDEARTVKTGRARRDAHRRRRRGVQGGGAVVGALIVIIAVFAGISVTRSHSSAPVRVTGNPDSGVVPANAKPGWMRLPKAPIVGRYGAVTAWTGKEVVVFGGFEGPVRSAGCPAIPFDPRTATGQGTEPPCGTGSLPTGPLRDGAAYNPSANTWQRVAALPTGYSAAESNREGLTSAVAVDGKIYVLVDAEATPASGGPIRVGIYDPADNRWSITTVLANFSQGTINGQSGWALTRFGHKVVAYDAYADPRIVPAQIFDPATGRWSALGDGGSVEPTNGGLVVPNVVQMVGLGTKLYRFTTVTSLGRQPTEIDVDVFDGHRWTSFTHRVDAVIPTPVWAVTGDHVTMVNTELLTLPPGAKPPDFGPALLSFDPSTGTFSTPDGPNRTSLPLSQISHTVVSNGTSLALVTPTGSAILDGRSDRWTTMAGPTSDKGLLEFSATWAGEQLFFWGGRTGGVTGQSISPEGWIWTPPDATTTGTSTTSAHQAAATLPHAAPVPDSTAPHSSTPDTTAARSPSPSLFHGADADVEITPTTKGITYRVRPSGSSTFGDPVHVDASINDAWNDSPKGLADATVHVVVLSPDSVILNGKGLTDFVVGVRSCGPFRCAVYEVPRAREHDGPTPRVEVTLQGDTSVIPLDQVDPGAGMARFQTGPN